MKNIQIKIDNNVATFNNEIEVISYMADRLSKNKVSSKPEYSKRVLTGVEQAKAFPNHGTKMTMSELKEYLLNA